MIVQTDNYISITYHYVHDPTSQETAGGIFPCSTQEFDRQIRFLSENYKIVSIHELYEAARSGEKGKFCALTFDDATKDHYQTAFPILNKYGVIGTFFVISGALQGKVPASHKIHLLRQRLSVKDFVKLYHDFICARYPDLLQQHSVPVDYFLDPNEKYDDMLTSNFKTTMARLPQRIADEFLLSIFQKLNLNESKEANKLFLSAEDILELKKKGMNIGAHSHTHGSFLTLSSEEVIGELNVSKKILSKATGEDIVLFSYPHGQYNPEHLEIFPKIGFQYAATTEGRGFRNNENRFLLPRYDTTDLKKIINSI